MGLCVPGSNVCANKHTCTLSTLFVIKSIPTISEVEKMYGRHFEEAVWLGGS